MSLHDLPKHYAVIGALLFTGLTGTSALAVELKSASIDPAAITAITFSLADENIEQFGFNLSRQQIAEQVSKNLAEWQFPVKLADSHYSHTLEARLDKIVHQETPVGFSFSSGNADPRAADFQKTDVLPISCRLSKIGSTGSPVEHKMTFSAHGLFTDSSQTKITEKLIDQISTTCFDLLDDLKIPTPDKKPETTSFKPTWMPTVQVVVKQVPGTVNTEKPDAGDSDNETNKVSDKELIINNQGSPLTLHLGHERR
jgi:hypothetical protein